MRSWAEVCASRRWNCTTLLPGTLALTQSAPLCGSMPRMLRIRKSPGRYSLEQACQHFARRTSVELANEILVRHRYEHRLADRATALRDDGVDLDVAGQRERDAARVVDLAAEV